LETIMTSVHSINSEWGPADTPEPAQEPAREPARTALYRQTPEVRSADIRPQNVLRDALLRQDLLHLARQPRLLVACDYDGTLAAIVPDHRSVRPLPESAAALRILASLPDTAAAVISGRALRELAAMSRLPSEVHLIGSHGSEFDTGFVYGLDEQTRALHARIVSALEMITGNAPGVLLEIKPASIAVHVRQAEPHVAEQVLARVASGPARWDGVQVTHGKAGAQPRVPPRRCGVD